MSIEPVPQDIRFPIRFDNFKQGWELVIGKKWEGLTDK